jgi:hypothetical protein
MSLKRVLFVAVLFSATPFLYGQDKAIGSWALNAQYGFIFAHSTSVQNTSGSRPFAIQLERAKQFFDTASWDLCACHPKQGVLINYTDYDAPFLGQGLQAGYFLEPSFFLSEKLEGSVRATAGLSAGNKPFHPVRNPSNQSYSTLLNGYLALGLHASWKFHPSWQLSLFAQYNHISNGGLKDPNKGINWPTAGIGLRYYTKTFRLPDYSGRRASVKRDRWRTDLAAFYSSRVIRPGEKKRYSIYGMQAQLAIAKGRIHAWSLGAELSYDGALKERLRRAGEEGHSGVLSGIAVGHEFLLGRFVFAQQLGIYPTDYGPYYNLLYHRWSLWRRINRHLGLGMSLKAHGQVANFADARLIYTIQ